MKKTESKLLQEKSEASVFMKHHTIYDMREYHFNKAFDHLHKLYEAYSDSEGIDPNYDNETAISIWRLAYDLLKLCEGKLK